MRFSIISLALCAVGSIATPIVSETSDIAARQDHPAGPGRDALIKLLGKQEYNLISKQVHTVGIAAAKLTRAVNGEITGIDPTLGALIHVLLQKQNNLEAELVSIGFNT